MVVKDGLNRLSEKALTMLHGPHDNATEWYRGRKSYAQVRASMPLRPSLLKMVNVRRALSGRSSLCGVCHARSHALHAVQHRRMRFDLSLG